MQTVESYDSSKSMRDKVLYVLSVMEKASANEVAMEIVELDGISTEEGVAEITMEVENEIHKLLDEQIVDKLREHRQKVRYVLNTKKLNQLYQITFYGKEYKPFSKVICCFLTL